MKKESSPDREQSLDPLIDEIRGIRKAISDRFGNDVDRLCEHLRQIEAENKDRVVSPAREPRRRAPTGRS